MKSAKILLMVMVVSVILSVGGCAGLGPSVDRSSGGNIGGPAGTPGGR